jgi:hypothetical protein
MSGGWSYDQVGGLSCAEWVDRIFSPQHLGVHRLVRHLIKLYSDPHALVLVINATQEVGTWFTGFPRYSCILPCAVVIMYAPSVGAHGPLGRLGRRRGRKAHAKNHYK